MLTNKTSNQYLNVNTSESSILDFSILGNKKNNETNTLELVDGCIKSIIGKDINSLNEFTVAAAAQNFITYINKRDKKGNVFVAHDGSFYGLLFSKVFASILKNGSVSVYFNYENKPLNDALSIFIANKSNIDFEHIVTFSNSINKNQHTISFFDKRGFLLSSDDSKEINALMSETNFLNLKISRLEIPMIENSNYEQDYLSHLKSNFDFSNLDVSITNTFKLNQDLFDKFIQINRIKCDFVDNQKNFRNENQITRHSINSNLFKNKDIIINFNTSINNFEILVKYKKRWKFITLNDFALIYFYYRAKFDEKIDKNKKVYSSYFASKYINFFAKKEGFVSDEYSILSEVLSNETNSNNFLLATDGLNYFVTDQNNFFCSDPLLNIKLLFEIASFFKKQGKTLYEVLTSIFLDNGSFHFNSIRENINFENASVFFNKLQRLKQIDGKKVLKIEKKEKISMCYELHLEDKIIITFQYFRNRNLLISNYSVWGTTSNNYIDLIVKEKRIINEISSLNENLEVKKFSWSAFIKYSVFVILFIFLCYIMIAFVLDSDKDLWKQIKDYLKAEPHFAYLIPIFILASLFQIAIGSWTSMRILVKLNEKVKLRHVFIANFISICISTVTPLIYGGEGVGYWYLRRKGANKAPVAAMFLIQSLLTQINFIIFSIIFLPIGYVHFYDIILNQGNGVFIIVLVIVGTIIDVFSAIMIALLTFSVKLQNSIAKDIKRLIEWLPFIVVRNVNERVAKLKYDFSNINIAARKIFTGDLMYKNIFISLELIFYKILARFFDWGILSAIVGNMLVIDGSLVNTYIDMIAGQTLVRSVNAINFLIPGGLGISDWATQNILVSMFKYNTNIPSDMVPEYYNVNVWQALSRIMYTFAITMLSAAALLTVFIGESRIDKYKKIKKTLTDEEIQKGNIRIKSRFYSISIAPWIIGIIATIASWYLIYNFVIA